MTILGIILILVASILFGFDRAFVAIWRDDEFVEFNAFRKTIIFLIIVFYIGGTIAVGVGAGGMALAISAWVIIFILLPVSPMIFKSLNLFKTPIFHKPTDAEKYYMRSLATCIKTLGPVTCPP